MPDYIITAEEEWHTKQIGHQISSQALRSRLDVTILEILARLQARITQIDHRAGEDRGDEVKDEAAVGSETEDASESSRDDGYAYGTALVCVLSLHTCCRYLLDRT